MGGAIRRITRVFSPPPAQAPAPVQQVVAAAPKPTVSGTQKVAKLRGQGYGTGTVMTGATGIEEEANVSKTMLGEGLTKKKKKYA
jgi:hypothetical protein|tara:strand:+ start:167 stop:421 length:255 start_codon:yes stop_codon:yes gene_type:complete